MDQKIITIQPKEAGERLDKFLAKQLPDFSRSFIQKLIKEKKVTVNQKPVPAHTKLKNKDVIIAEIIKPKEIFLAPDVSQPLDIVFEDKDFLVINKPARLVVHPSQDHPDHTLVNTVLAYFPKIKDVGENHLRPGIVHRLDKEVSGLIVLAKNQMAFEHLKKQFQDRKIEKRYTALVYGKMSQSSGSIDFNIGRSKSKPYRMSIKQAGEGKTASTSYQVLKSSTKYSLLEITTKTGRTHQIRVHLHALGHPIVGDQLYRIKKIKLAKDLDRIFLHASFLRFQNLNGETLTFLAELPLGLKQYLIKKLKEVAK